MWIFTRHGFFSIVCARKELAKPGQDIDSDLLMVRARVRSHLTALRKRFRDELGGCEIRQNEGTDYRFRLLVEKSVWSRVAGMLAEEIDYGNFKDEVAEFQGRSGAAYERALHEVWAVMYGLQR